MIYIFQKGQQARHHSGRNVRLFRAYNVSTVEEALVLVKKEIHNNIQHYPIIELLMTGSYSYNTQDDRGGCLFVMDGDEKALHFLCDEIWIHHVKQEAKKFKGKEFYFVEIQRFLRQGKNIDKLLKRLREGYPSYKPVAIDYAPFEQIAADEIKKMTI
jgi:hypothetical protein